jgi:hypothetical protein
MTVPGNIDALMLGGLGGYQIERSLRFNSPDSAYLTKTFASSGNSKLWTWSAWVKRCKLGSTNVLFGSAPASNQYTYLAFTSTDQLLFEQYQTSMTIQTLTTQVFRDVSAWFHLVVVYDSAQATSTNRYKLYVNGQQVTAFAATTYPSLNADTYINQSTYQHGIGVLAASYTSILLDAYLTEINFVDGQALTPSSFGETNTVTGVWGPKRYAGTYGTNGFYLKFADNSNTTAATLGKDSSGNGNNWTPNNFSVTAGVGNDSFIDVPTPYADGGNGRGNYCTFNPLLGDALNLPVDGNLRVGPSASGVYSVGTVTFPTSGKYYAEATVTTYSSGQVQIGICPANAKSNLGSDATAYFQDGTTTKNNSASTTLTSYTQGDVIGIAVDVNNSTVQFYKNNTAQTALTSVLRITDASFFAYMSVSSSVVNYNFGQRPFTYTPPTGFLALNTQNLPEPSIKKPNQWFNAVAYSGSASSVSVTGVGFQPDLIWTKSRSTTFSHGLFDSVRGFGSGATKILSSNNTNAESTQSNILTVNSDGFTTGTTSVGETNSSGNTYISWNWKESATPGFDIVTYTGNGAADRTVAHSLGVAPAFFVIKNRTTATDWPVYHKSLPSHDGGNYPTNSLRLNTTGALANTLGLWAAPSSTVITVSDAQLSAGNRPLVNTNGDTYVAYLWSEVAGFSKFGSYTGNNSTDGPFVHCGFRPRYVLVKDIISAGYWSIFDAVRSSYNVGNQYLQAQSSSAEDSTSPQIDFLSNGFKLRANNAASAQNNLSGNTYIFAAFAESPFKYSLAR